jgi:hypothetical protein
MGISVSSVHRGLAVRWWIGKDLEGISRCLIEVMFPYLSGKADKGHRTQYILRSGRDSNQTFRNTSRRRNMRTDLSGSLCSVRLARLQFQFLSCVEANAGHVQGECPEMYSVKPKVVCAVWVAVISCIHMSSPHRLHQHSGHAWRHLSRVTMNDVARMTIRISSEHGTLS